MTSPSDGGFRPYDLRAARRLPYLAYQPMQAVRSEPATYLAPPLAAGDVRVKVCDDYYLGWMYRRWTGEKTPSPEDILDIAQDVYDRWEAAANAYLEMQEEIGRLVKARRPGSWRPVYQVIP